MLKKILLTAIAGLMGLAATAQISFWDTSVPTKIITYGPRIGLNVSHGAGGLFDNTDAKSGLLLGMEVDFNIFKSFSINSGLYFTMKGAKQQYATVSETSNEYETENLRYTVNYLELPIYASYRLNLGRSSQLQVNLGPYLDLAIYGKYNEKQQNATETMTYSTSLRNYSDSYHRFNVGIGLGVAYTWHKYYVAMQYQWDITDTLNSKVESTSDLLDPDTVADIVKGDPGRFMTFNITVGYNF